jgi:hypothetical protein
MKEFSESATPGAFIADIIPPLARIPERLQWWRPRALKYQKRQISIWMKYWNDLQMKIDQKKAPECFVKQFTETDYKAQGISEVQGAFVAGTMIEVRHTRVGHSRTTQLTCGNRLAQKQLLPL